MEELKKILVEIDDQIYETHSTVAFDRKQKWKHPDDRIIKSIIPGTIIEVSVKKGQSVKEGELMLIIEAMKMNNRLTFSKDGIVDQILVNPGDVVSRGQDLIIIK
jgi:biotin carboxyl carrier protein